jgi:hypothetical protein
VKAGKTLALFAVASLVASCGGGSRRPEIPPLVVGRDGREHHMVARGPYKAYYDRLGRLESLEYDSNGDGRPDLIAHHDGAAKPYLVEVDEDFDGKTDRWESYDPSGTLLKMGASRRSRGPDTWTFPGPGGVPARKEYDDDGDGKLDRVETFEGGRIVRVEVDSDRDGRMDRFQEWRDGRLAAEELDTNGDGRPDRRLHYGKGGSVVKLEALDRRAR